MRFKLSKRKNEGSSATRQPRLLNLRERLPPPSFAFTPAFEAKRTAHRKDLFIAIDRCCWDANEAPDPGASIGVRSAKKDDEGEPPEISSSLDLRIRGYGSRTSILARSI